MHFGIATLMSFYTFKTYAIISRFFPKFLWKKPATFSKTIYLTFDDGPTPKVTEQVLEILKKYNAKATFFLVGKNAFENPKIVENILLNGHSIGNHTHNHLKGSETPFEDYVKNMELAEKVLPKTQLFRPPYGRITTKQAKNILDRGYKIVMWDVLSGDFDTTLSPKKSLYKVLKNAKNGSIIVFHDSIKAERIVLEVLPKALEIWTKKGFRFEKL